MVAQQHMSPTIHIVDDDVDFAEGMAWLLDSRGIAVRIWNGGQEFLDGLAAEESLDKCSVVVLDIRMEPMSGLATFERLKSLGWPWPVLFLTGHGDLPMAVSLVKAGAWDFLEKPFQNNLLVDKLEAAQKAALTWDAEQHERRHFRSALAALSTREREVLAQLLQGHYNKNIADHLGITQRTIEFHRANIFGKLKVQTAVELAHLVGRYGHDSE
jgi:two-component system response regulator DctR